MAACWIAALLLALACWPIATADSVVGAEDKFCIVVRTYRGHADPVSGLPRLLRSLQRQSHQSWEAILLVMDGYPFEDLHHIVAEVDDPRIWVFAEWIGADFAARTAEGVWNPDYHSLLYNLTDDAVIGCAEDTTWLLVTNGDNDYGDGFLARAVAEGRDPGVDIVAFDFYSRYARPTAPQCERLARVDSLDAPVCKRNRLRWCHTDLGSFVLRAKRFQAEARGFGLGLRPATAPDMSAEHADGQLVAALVQDLGWHAVHVTDACLFSHSPSPMACAAAGGVWDDRNMATWHAGGGECIAGAGRDWVLANDPNAELVSVVLATDGNVSVFESGKGVTQPLTMQCLRRRDYLAPHVWGAAMDWYSELCADDLDLPAQRAWQAQRAQHAAAEAGTQQVDVKADAQHQDL